MVLLKIVNVFKSRRGVGTTFDALPWRLQCRMSHVQVAVRVRPVPSVKLTGLNTPSLIQGHYEPVRRERAPSPLRK